MPENFTRQLDDRSEKPKNESEFFTIIEKGLEGLIIKLKPNDQLSRPLNRLSAADFKQQLTNQIKSQQPNRIIIDLAQQDIDKDIIGALNYVSQQTAISKKNFILCGVSKIIEDRLKGGGFLEKIFTINDTINDALDNLN